ncbi:MFS transporter [Nonomuraea sp. NPDC050536]|uniref:MFS transporter n=1 Tax=Nonomuraea sp. NPDC050536 TaxID=3364366 RepID=UPI0037C724C3
MPILQRIPATVALGALFNPLNSSMIAVALVPIATEFDVGIVAVTWLAAGFYLTAVLAPPVMGTLADRIGPKAVFIGGLALVGVTGALAAMAPGFGWLVAMRLLQAFGTCATFPAGMAIVRTVIPGPDGRPPPRLIAVISMVLTSSAAAGPVLGGLLVTIWGWRAVFLVNVPLALLAIVLGWKWLPRVAGDGRRERRLPRPNAALLGTCGQNALVNVIFYLAFIGVPLWAQHTAGVSAGVAGLLVLPMAALGVLAMPAAVALAARAGLRAVLVAAAVLMAGGSAAMFLVGPVGIVPVATALLGLGAAFNQFGLNTLVYVHAERRDTGSAVGLFQASRFVGAGLAAPVTGLLFGAGVTDGGWAMAAITVVVLAASLVLPVKTSDEESPMSD